MDVPLAYIDPGSGSLILQMVLAGIVGVVAFFRHSILGLFRRPGKSQPAEPKETAAPPEPKDEP